MAELAPSLIELSRRYGVATEYLDWKGQHVVVPETTLVAVLGALGVAATTEDDRVAALAAYDRDYWERCLPPTIVGRSGSASSFWVHVTHGDPIGLWIRLEDGSVRTGLRKLENNRAPYDLDGRWVGEATVELPGDLPLGYHAVHLQVGSFDTSTPLIVSPGSLELPPRLGRRRTWGLATQLYSVRSQRSWGMGDLTDLTDLAVWSGSRHGAGFVLVNPLHAAAPTTPMEPSPYLPTSRRFVNPLYLRVEAIPEFAYVRDRGPIRKAGAKVQARADQVELIDRDAAWKAKRAALARSTGWTGRRAGRWRTPPTAPARAAAWTTSPSGARWPRSTAATGTSGRRRYSTRPTPRLRSSPPNTPTPSTFIAGCSGSSTTSSPRHSRRRWRRACLSASCTTSRSVWTRMAPTRGRCRMCWPWRHGRRAARRVQPARAGLVAAAAAARPARRAGL